jgi:protein-disulfide isomerase
MSWRAAFLGALLVALGCRQSGHSEADPVYATALPGVEAVDGALDAMVDADGQPRLRVVVGEGDPSKGAAEPLVVIVEFSDFGCPHCGRAADAFAELVAAYPQDVRLVFKQFPLPMHPDAEIAARATIAAAAQGRFWAMHDRLFAMRKTKREDVVEYAKELGLDVASFEAALDDPATAARVQADKDLGVSVGVRGTPSFFVNGRPFSGALPPDKLREIVDGERKLGQALVDAGSARTEVYARIQRRAVSP